MIRCTSECRFPVSAKRAVHAACSEADVCLEQLIAASHDRRRERGRHRRISVPARYTFRSTKLPLAVSGDRSIAHFPTGNTRKCGPTGKFWLHSTIFPGFPRWRRAGKLGDSWRRFPLLSEVPARPQSASWVQLDPTRRVNRVRAG
eukprot:124053-Chlamydomonas_euryale.AAC.2